MSHDGAAARPDGLLIKSPRWAGTAPANPRTDGQILGKAPRMEGQAIHESHPSKAADAILSSQPQASHLETHRRFSST